MLFFINFLNLLSCFFLYIMEYSIVRGTDDGSNSFDLRYFLFFLVVSIFYKLYIYYNYGVNYTIFSIYTLYSSNKLTVIDKILNLLLVVINTFILCGLGLIFVKVILIELNFNLLGKIKILPFFFSDLHIIKFYSLFHKEYFMKSLLQQALLDDLFHSKLTSLSKDNYDLFINDLKNCVYSSENLFEIKKHFDMIYNNLCFKEQKLSWYDFYNRGIAIVYTSTVIVCTYLISDYFFPLQVRTVRNNMIATFIGQLFQAGINAISGINVISDTSFPKSPLTDIIVSSDLDDNKSNMTLDGNKSIRSRG